MEQFHRKTLENIERFGCSVLHIAQEGSHPPFSYSVGITQTSNAPEAFVIGLKQELAHAVINGYNRRVRAGERFTSGKRYSGFLEGFEVEARKVAPSFYDEYFGMNLRFYKGANFEVLQLIYPDTKGAWPWEAGASEWFKSWQPVLAEKPVRHP